MIAQIIVVIAWIAVAAAVFTAGYFALLTAVALWPRRHRVAGAKPACRFAIIVPAHDEEAVLAATLKSCRGQEYPRGLFDVFVIADNCSDRTAEIAMAGGAECLERTDLVRKGKGYALEWAFERILPRGHDAVVVLDADCELSSNALRMFDGYLQAGDAVLQADNVQRPADDTALSLLLAAANILENDCFHKPKCRLGLSVFLRGTGMVFRRQVLEELPWRAYSIAEDAEYSLRLFRRSIRVRYVPETSVVSELPSGRDRVSVQRGRWTGGGLSVLAKNGPSLIAAGFRGEFRLLEAVWTLLVASRPVVILQLVSSTLLSLAALAARADVNTFVMAGTIAAIWAFYALYFVVGIERVRQSTGSTLSIRRLLVEVVSYVSLTLKSAYGGHGGVWKKTPRNVEGSTCP